jgi:hypothetical protein
MQLDLQSGSHSVHVIIAINLIAYVINWEPASIRRAIRGCAADLTLYARAFHKFMYDPEATSPIIMYDPEPTSPIIINANCVTFCSAGLAGTF